MKPGPEHVSMLFQFKDGRRAHLIDLRNDGVRLQSVTGEISPVIPHAEFERDWSLPGPATPAELVRFPPGVAHVDSSGRLSASAPIDYRALLVSVLKYHPIAARGESHTDAEWAELQRLAEEGSRG